MSMFQNQFEKTKLKSMKNKMRARKPLWDFIWMKNWAVDPACGHGQHVRHDPPWHRLGVDGTRAAPCQGMLNARRKP